MPNKKFLSKEQCLAAMAKTHSVRACARYLNCSYQHLKKYLKLYKDEEGVTLFDKQKNRHGKGIPKFLKNNRREPHLADIVEGRANSASFDPHKIKWRLIQEGYLNDECYKCGYHERRVSDYQIPLVLNFKDNNKTNFGVDNIELLCYNCYFIYIGDLFNNKQLQGIEDYKTVNKSEIEWEVDDYTKQRLDELGLNGPPKLPTVDDGSELISRI